MADREGNLRSSRIRLKPSVGIASIREINGRFPGKTEFVPVKFSRNKIREGAREPQARGTPQEFLEWTSDRPALTALARQYYRASGLDHPRPCAHPFPPLIQVLVQRITAGGRHHHIKRRLELLHRGLSHKLAPN